jgi:glycosyltransferase involved in cell wall biosynthesis
MDYYDADYLSNYKLTFNSIKNAHKVSVSTHFLENKFKSVNPKTYVINMTIDEKDYLVKKRYDQGHIRIGWMGNPGNIEYLQKIKDELKLISERYDNVSFHFLCRRLPKFDINNLYTYNWDNTQFNYFQWLSSIDIGIIPYIGDNDRLKAKSAMKTLEFMACGIPLITTEHGKFTDMLHNEHYLLATKNGDWLQHLIMLIENPEKRKEIGQNGYNFFIDNNTYKNNYSNLKNIFFN